MKREKGRRGEEWRVERRTKQKGGKKGGGRRRRNGKRNRHDL